jgi:hypothetical protein
VIIFLSYAKEDAERVAALYDQLKAAGFQPWMDKYDIVAGQDWKAALQSAISRCDAGIICLSNNSVSKTGYVQVEVKEFLEQRKRRPEGSIYLIPIRLENCPVPIGISDLHYADLFETDGWERLIASLEEAGRQKSAREERGELRGTFSIFTRVIEEKWQGLPGYSVRLSYPELRGGPNPALCDELNEVFKARQLSTLQAARVNFYEQDEEFWKDRPIMAQYETIVDHKITFASDAALSVVAIFYEYTGGAHGMHYFRSDNFALQPLARLPLAAFFKTGTNYLVDLGTLSREALEKLDWERSVSDQSYSRAFDNEFGRDWLYRGTSLDETCTIEFTFSDAGLTLYFPPYQVAAYAFGAFEVTLPYYDLRDVLRPDGPHLLFLPRI